MNIKVWKGLEMGKLNIGDKFYYNSDTIEYSFSFIVYGIQEDKVNIIVNRDSSPSLYRINIKEFEKCQRITDDE